MLPKQFGNPQSSQNPATACVHIFSVGVGKYSGCKTFQSSWQTSVTMLETVDRPTRKEKAMVWWLSPVARYLKKELKVVYTIVLCGVLHGNSLFCDCLCNCTNIQVWQIINKMPFSFYNLIFSYFLRWNIKTIMEKFKRFLHEVQEVPERYDGTSPPPPQNSKNCLEVVICSFWTVPSHLVQQPPIFQKSRFQKPDYRAREPHHRIKIQRPALHCLQHRWKCRHHQ